MKRDALIFGAGSALFTGSAVSYGKVSVDILSIGLVTIGMVVGAAVVFYVVIKNLKQ